MTPRAVFLEDKMAFLLAIQRVEPKVFEELRALGAEASRSDIDAWLKRWHLDGAGLDAVEMLMEARSGFVGVPALAGFIPRHDWTITLSWEPGDGGERRSEFMKRATEALQAYADRIEVWAKDNGVEARARERETGEAEAGVARWDLLVSRLVLQQTYEEIGAALGISKQGAEKHVRNLAKRLGVSL